MRLVSVNVSLPKLVEFRGRAVSTSIFKEPVAGRLFVRRLSLEGDWQADLSSHGGLNKAVYAYPWEHYAWWSQELGHDGLRPGQFGENLTVEGLTEDVVHLGDVFRIGGVLLQVTQPRYPCFKLGIKMGDPLFPKRFLASGRTGFYLRVVQEGELGIGDMVELAEGSDRSRFRGTPVPESPRWLLTAGFLTALVVFAVCSPRPTAGLRAADPPRESPGVTVYDPNPRHLWNRLHEALHVRLDGEGPDDPGELDPFLWQRSPYLEKGEPYKRAAAVLDEFLGERGERLITDPRKRALLQRDLWALFDKLAPPRFLVAPDKMDGETELAVRAAKILPRLALTADQIKGLADNYAAAAAAKKCPDWFDGRRLWDADGPWVLLGSGERVPLARTHVEFFGGRSAFFVFLRLPEGREQTRKYAAALRSNGTAPRLPEGGAYFALVRQMQLIDDRGRITLTPVVETLQIRGLGAREYKLSRKDFLAGKPSLAALGPEDRERDYLIFLGRNAGDGRSKVLNSCGQCHRPDTMESYVRNFPPSQSVRPSMTASNRDEEARRAWVWKKDRYEWGLLQGLILAPTRE